MTDSATVQYYCADSNSPVYDYDGNIHTDSSISALPDKFIHTLVNPTATTTTIQPISINTALITHDNQLQPVQLIITPKHNAASPAAPTLCVESQQSSYMSIDEHQPGMIDLPLKQLVGSQLPSQFTDVFMPVNNNTNTINAFELMSQSSQHSSHCAIPSKRKSLSNTPNQRTTKKSAHSTPINDGSRFMSCPLCNKSFVQFEIESHAAGCTGETIHNNTYKTPHNNKTQSKCKPLSNNTNKSNTSRRSTNINTSAYDTCPLCLQQQPKALLSMHMNRCVGTLLDSQSNESINTDQTNNMSDESQIFHTDRTTDHSSTVVITPSINETMNELLSQQSDSNDDRPAPLNALLTPPVSPNNNENHNNINVNSQSVATDIHPLFTGGALTGAAFKQQQRNKYNKKPVQTLLFLIDYDHNVNTDLHYITMNDISNPTVYNRSYGIQWYFIQSDTQHEYNPMIDVIIDNGSARLVNDDMTECINKQQFKQCAQMMLHEPDTSNGITKLLLYQSTYMNELRLCDVSSHTLSINQYTGKRWYLSASQLKSILQKHIRLSNSDSAVRIALQLIQQHSILELLRRIVICCIEDSIVHPMIPYIVWLTVYYMKNTSHDKLHQQLVIPYLHINTVLQFVYEIANSTTKDNILQDECTGDNHTTTLLSDISDLSIPQQNLTRSLLMRSTLGGMKSDMSLIKSYTTLWLNRYRHDNQKLIGIHSNNVQPVQTQKTWVNLCHAVYNRSRRMVNQPGQSYIVQIYNIDYITHTDLVLSGIDQHCSNLIKDLSSDKCRASTIIAQFIKNNNLTLYAQSIDELIGTMIWNNRSSITNKALLRKQPDTSSVDSTTHKLSELYKLIQIDIDKICERIIAQRMKW